MLERGKSVGPRNGCAEGRRKVLGAVEPKGDIDGGKVGFNEGMEMRREVGSDD